MNVGKEPKHAFLPKIQIQIRKPAGKSTAEGILEQPELTNDQSTNTSLEDFKKNLNRAITETDNIPESSKAVSGDPEGAEMAYNDYYQRLLSTSNYARSYETAHMVGQSLSPHRTIDSGAPMFRAGRLGAPWRHVTQCTGNEGNHICFIDGSVKENDMSAYPPYGFISPRPRVSHTVHQAPPPVARSAPSLHRYSNTFSNHAKNGFKYWPEEKNSMPGYQSIGGRLMKLGIGY